MMISNWKTLWSPWFIQTYFSVMRVNYQTELRDMARKCLAIRLAISARSMGECSMNRASVWWLVDQRANQKKLTTKWAASHTEKLTAKWAASHTESPLTAQRSYLIRKALRPPSVGVTLGTACPTLHQRWEDVLISDECAPDYGRV